MKPHNRIYSLTFCFVLMLWILTGCWDNKDINHRLLPVAVGIKKIDNEYMVMLDIPEPTGGSKKTKIVSAKEETISKAVDTISKNMESDVDLLHVKLILIQRGTAEDGVKDIIAGFMRSREVSPKALVAVCDQDINEFFTEIEKTTAEKGLSTYNFFEKNAGWNPDIALTRIWEVYRGIHSYTHDVAIPMIRSGKSTPMEQVGSAILKNGKMVEEISSNETLLYNVFKGESSHGEIEVMEHATVMILSSKIAHESFLQNRIPYMISLIKMKVVIIETKGDPSSNLIKKEMNTVLSKRFQELFLKLQKSEADIFGVGQFYRNQIPRKELKNWRSDYYKNMKMDIQLKIEIQNEGYLKTT
ncbi:Ger(x)C family spore germination protein [Bacillus suaedaesalsae]|uniref:Ger(X)C family spore germination protein n=1 Tax=Bacillus suaedaesalsae TaxID=2810349 RepID=A0ABS2DJT9_9BACI|nr:Ger(x)C family spore germination protein [Bacillus suaedaesalsae]MBM6617816.1 Ger(x)C family spore germination protein [Bacillus suaedaesalsae]